MKENNGSSAVKKLLRKAFPALAALFCTVLLSACGATVSTTLDTDADFKGTRTITAELSSGDLNDYIKGGEAAIESTVKKYIPDVLEYTHKSENGALTYTFTFSFSGIDDYRSKIEKIISARPDSELVPEVKYENFDNPFRKELYLEENFSSIDLLGWLKYGLKTEEVVDHDDQSDWFESGSSTVIYDGSEYDSSSKLNVKRSEYNSPDRIDVITTVNPNGTVDRSFKFAFGSDEIQSLEEASVDLGSYFSSLSANAAVEKTEDEYGGAVYEVKLSGIAPENANTETALIMHDGSAAFTLSAETYTASEDEDYDVLFKVSELVSGAYYTKNTIYCMYYFPEGALILDDPEANIYVYSRTDEEDRIYAMFENKVLEDEAVPSFSMVWKVGFDEVSAELAFSGDKPSLAVNMYVPADLMETAKTPVKAKLEKAMPDGASFTEEQSKDGAYTVFKADMKGGTSEEVATRYKQFIYNYTGIKSECSFSFEKGKSGSPFVTFGSYNAVFDMTGLSGGEPVSIIYNKTPGEKVFVTENCSFKADAEQTDSGAYTGTSDSRVRFCAATESVNIAGILICIIIAVSAVLLIIIAAANAKSWADLAKTAAAAMPKPAPMPSAPSAPSAPVSNGTAAPAPEQQPVHTAAQEENNNTAEDSGDDEEEFI